MDYTTNYNLVKPAKSQKAWDILVNDNFDKIDNEIKNTNNKIGDISQLDNGNVVAELESHATALADNASNLFKNDLVSHKKQKPIITLIDDDGRVEVYNILKQIAINHNIPYTSALPTARIGTDGFLNISQINELKQVGFEFVSHTLNHTDLSTLATEGEIIAELEDSKEFLERNGLEDEVFVYPNGGYSDLVKALVRKYYRCGIGIDYGNSKVNYPPLDTYLLQRVTFVKDTAIIKSRIDEAVANNGWIIVMTHCWDNFDVAKLNDIIAYAQAAGAEFVNVREGLARFGNIIDIEDKYGGFVVGADGSRKDYQVISYSSVSDSSPITDFPKGKSLVNYYLNHPNSLNFPFETGYKGAGYLETYYFDSNYNYQIWTTHPSKLKYMRTSVNGVWSSWEQINAIHVKNDALGSTLIADFKLGITISTIPVGSATGFPETAAGILTTYKPNNTAAYGWQEYKKYNLSEKYIRRAKTDGTWDVWEVDNPVGLATANSYNGLTPLTSFPYKKITYSAIDAATADSGIPEQSAGILATYYLTTSYGYCYQEFKKYASSDKYIRTANADSTWGTWYKETLTAI